MRAIPLHPRQALRGIALAAALLAPGWAAAQAPAAIDDLLGEMYPQLDTLYQDLHAHPELGFAETRTAARLARELRGLGFEVTEQVGKTGVVALLRNGEGPTVMVRTDMDALPMEEKTGLPYASRAKTTWNGRETFVAHSCGHDVHMAAWVGVARTLAAMRPQWRGTLMLVAQPAEETGGGARAMIDDRIFERFGKPDVVLGQHIAPLPAGAIGLRAGASFAASDAIEITLYGRGGHGSRPEVTVDPVVMAAAVIMRLQTVVSREIAATEVAAEISGTKRRATKTKATAPASSTSG